MSLPGLYNRSVRISPIERPGGGSGTTLPPPSLQTPTAPPGAPTSPSKSGMPTIDGTPIGAFGAQWGGSGYQYDPSTNPRAQQWMQWMQQYDPSAKWQQSEVGGQNQWNFTQDNPGAEGKYPELANALKPYGGGMTQERVFEHGDYVHPDSDRYKSPVPLKDPGMVFNGPAGRYTMESNMKHPRDLIGQMGPAVIAGIATMMSGGAASPMLISLLSRSPQMLAQLTSGGGFNPMSLVGMAGGALGLPSWATTGAGALASLANQRRRRPGGP